MALSQTAEHALRALLFLARQPAGERVAAQSIADALGAPRNYLSKTLGTLAKAGIVDSARGPAGGFRLRVAPAELSVAMVVAAVDDHRSSGVCLLGGRRCDASRPCVAHEVWSRTRAAAAAPLERTTIAELLGVRQEAATRSAARSAA